MRYLKNLGRVLGYISIIIIILTMLVTIFSYFNIFSDNLTKIIKFIIPIISVFIGGIMMGIRATKKGIVEGARLSLIIIMIFLNCHIYYIWINDRCSKKDYKLKEKLV